MISHSVSEVLLIPVKLNISLLEPSYLKGEQSSSSEHSEPSILQSRERSKREVRRTVGSLIKKSLLI